MKLSISDISVVVQGAISSQYTPTCFQSIRSALPGAEIILSTWKGTDVRGLDYDTLVLSDDPGSFLLNPDDGAQNNINRQIVSTKAGLEVAKRKYCLKFRTDMELRDAGFLSFWGKYDTEQTPAQYFHYRLLICNYYTRNPRILPLPFHPSDWTAFGLTEDVKKYYDLPLQNPEELIWFKTHEKRTRCMHQILCRYVPEQTFCIGFLRKYREISCDNYYDDSLKNIVQTEEFLANNMVILDYGRQMDIRFLKYGPNKYGDRYNILYHNDWHCLYRKYSKGERGAFWAIYRLRAAFLHFWSYPLRRFAVRILELLGLKQLLKRLLSKAGK